MKSYQSASDCSHLLLRPLLINPLQRLYGVECPFCGWADRSSNLVMPDTQLVGNQQESL